MSLHNGTKRKSGRIMRKPLTSKDREHYVHKLREREGRTAWTVNKSRFGQNDILGCIDTISYTPWDIFMDQTSTVNHISHKRAEIKRMLTNAPETAGVSIFVHGIDGYREKRDNVWVPVITRHVMEQWIDDDDWERTEMPVLELASEGSDEMKGNGRATMNPPETGHQKTNSKRTQDKLQKVKP